MLSRFLRIREKNGVVAIFHELHPDPIYMTMSAWRSYISSDVAPADIVTKMKEEKLLVDSPQDDDDEFGFVETTLKHKLDEPNILYLMTAQDCNFNCRYCSVPEIARQFGSSRLSIEDAYAGIDLWSDHLRDSGLDKERYVIFYGGEPLLNKPAIHASLDRLATRKREGRLPERLHLLIVTNGVLMDEKMMGACREHDVMVAVSLDGFDPQGNSLRIDAEGGETFEKTIASIRKLVANGVRTCASASITSQNVANISRYSAFFEELGVEKHGFNFLRGRALLDLAGEGGAEEYYRQASKGVIENWRQQQKPGFEFQMEKKQIAFDSRDFFPVDCTCYGNQLVIQPDGQISNCPFSKQWLGHVREVGNDFRIWDQSVVAEWRKRLPLYYAGEAKALSGGGCACSSLELHGDPLVVDSFSNIFPEEVLNEFIWSRYQELKTR